jgi:hypothetical protein
MSDGRAGRDTALARKGKGRKRNSSPSVKDKQGFKEKSVSRAKKVKGGMVSTDRFLPAYDPSSFPPNDIALPSSDRPYWPFFLLEAITNITSYQRPPKITYRTAPTSSTIIVATSIRHS